MRSRRAARPRARPARNAWRQARTAHLGVLVLALLGAVAVGVGGFESRTELGFSMPVLGLAVMGAGLALLVLGNQQTSPGGWFQEASGPLLWTVAIWMLYRPLAAEIPQLLLLPAGYLGWITVSLPAGVVWVPLAAALGMEAGLAVGGEQSVWRLGFNLAALGGAVVSMRLFARSRVYRRQLRQALQKGRAEATHREYARDFGLLAAEEDPQAGRGASAVETLSSSFELQLDLLRRALDLTTVAVLWPDADGREMRLRGIVSSRTDLLTGPYPSGQGITGALFRTGSELAVAPVPGDYHGLPYYRNSAGVGSFYALRIPEGHAGGGILCADRESREPWAEETGRALRLAARKIALEVEMGRRFEAMDRERQASLQVYRGLCELNGVLGLESAFSVSMKVIRSLVHADFAAISLLEGDQLRVAHAEGHHSEGLIGLAFPREEGLAGQVLKMNHPLPAGGAYHGPAPIFCRSRRMAGFGSLLILPLRKEQGGPIGVLVVAARSRGTFEGAGRQLLELIATQVAIKIDLAQAHERINSMAATDGLTGLANHRTFQNGFDRMLYRAERQGNPLCLVLCDLDHFKQINDTWGHPFGDQVLKAVAEVLGKTVRQADLAARYGGEEFALLLEGTDRRTGLQVAERIRDRVQALAFRLEGESVSPTISGGLAVYPEDGRQKSILLARADQALYQAKESGRNRIWAWGGQPSEGEARKGGLPGQDALSR